MRAHGGVEEEGEGRGEGREDGAKRAEGEVDNEDEEV